MLITGQYLNELSDNMYIQSYSVISSLFFWHTYSLRVIAAISKLCHLSLSWAVSLQSSTPMIAKK